MESQDMYVLCWPSPGVNDAYTDEAFVELCDNEPDLRAGLDAIIGNCTTDTCNGDCIMYPIVSR